MTKSKIESEPTMYIKAFLENAIMVSGKDKSITEYHNGDFLYRLKRTIKLGIVLRTLNQYFAGRTFFIDVKWEDKVNDPITICLADESWGYFVSGHRFKMVKSNVDLMKRLMDLNDIKRD